MSNKSKIGVFVFATMLIILMIAFPDISSSGVARGMLISSNVIIPSLFPFMVCVLIIIKSDFSIKIESINKLLFKTVGLNFDLFFVFLMSLLGGYPVGARLINELNKQKTIDNKTADIMLTYCVNAGPSFVISVIGGAVYSKKIGIILLLSHITASIIMMLFCSKQLKKYSFQKKIIKIKSISEIFVESVADASSAIMGICSFVILFSSINSYIDYFFKNVTIIKYISFFTEVTSAVTRTKNVYFISFLLGFSGISIWCQIFAMSKNLKINYLRFVISRILHGIISVIITHFLIKFLNIKLSAFSNSINFTYELFYSNIVLFIAILTMFIVLLIFFYTKNNSGNIIDDVI